MSRWAATSTTRWRGPSGVSTIPSAWKSSTAFDERHRHLVLGLEAHGRLDLLAVVDRRQVERAQHRALVGDAEAHALVQIAVLEELAQRVREHALVEHLALAHDVRRQRRLGRMPDRDRTVHVRLHGGDVAGLDVQADDVRAAAAAELDVEVEGGSLHLRCDAWERIGASNVRADRPHGGYRREDDRALVEKVVDVQLDDVLTDEHGDERAEGEERTERDRGLAALSRALARDDDGADRHA